MRKKARILPSDWAHRVLDAALREDFSSFLQKGFRVINPGRSYQHNWHIDAMAWHLQKCERGEIKRLIITVPPRSLKSIAVSVAFPAWLLGRDPSRRIVCVSYSGDLARKHSLDNRTVMGADFYREIFPRTRISPDKNTELEFMTTARGCRLATSIDGTLTGRGGDFIIIDDPMKPSEALSDAQRESVNHRYDSTLYSRLDSKTAGVIILVMQRLHVDDLVGHVLARDNWVHLDIPAIADQDVTYEIGPGRDYHRKAGEVLHPEREPLEALERMKVMLGTYDFSAQYLQRPLPPGGNMVKWEWFKIYETSPVRESCDQVVQSWDTASKAGELNDYSVCTTWLVRKSDAYLLHVERARLDYPALKQRVIESVREFNPDAVLIEDKGSGTSLFQDLATTSVPCIAIVPEGDKVTRMSTVSAQIEAGRVHLPKEASWLAEFQAEIMQFPNGRYDDQVDSVSQCLNWVRTRDRHAAPLVIPVSIPNDQPFIERRDFWGWRI